MKFICTSDGSAVSAEDAILKGTCGDGKNYVPSSFPALKGDIVDLARQTFQERVAKVLSLFIDSLGFEKLLNIANMAYAQFEDVCPLVKIEDGLYVAELWHGERGSAADIVYALYPHILAALSDLKPYAVVNGCDVHAGSVLRGFASAGGATAFVAKDGVGAFDRLQLTTAGDDSAKVVEFEGSAKELAAALKDVRDDENFRQILRKKGVLLCVENSNDILKILIQVAIFASAYCDLVAAGELEEGQSFNLALPAGGLDLAVAGCYAMRMGVPVKTFILASNANNAVTDLVERGEFDSDRDFFRTSSTELDVLVPSELERFVFEFVGRDCEVTSAAMRSYERTGGFAIDEDDIESKDRFRAGWADEEDAKQATFAFFDLDDYIFDANSAVAASVYNDYSCETEDDTPTLLLSVANACRTASATLDALGTRERDKLRAIDKLTALTAIECPDCLSDLAFADETYFAAVKGEDVKQFVFELAIK